MSVTTPSSNNSGPIIPMPSALACSPAWTSTWLMSIGGSRSGVRGTRPTPRRRARVASRIAHPTALWPKVCSVVRRIAARSTPSDAQQLGVAGARSRHHAAVGQPAQRFPGGGQVDAVGFQDPAGAAAAVAQHPQDQVLGAEVAVAEPVGLLLGPGPGPGRACSAALGHGCYLRKPNRRPAYLWCTACLVTPRRAAICCQDQPLARAFSTCKASRTSTRPRRAATAASPTSGSWLLVAAATWVTSLEAASLITSI